MALPASKLILAISLIAGSAGLVSAGSHDPLGALIAPTPKPKPPLDRLDAGVPVEEADRAMSKQLNTKPSPRQASQLKACPVLVEERITAKYLKSTLDENLCGDEAPLEVSAIGTTKLIPPAKLNCRMASATADWVDELNQYAMTNHNAGVDSLTVGASFVCRRRNNKPDGKFSEHATMNAIDISGFTLEDGTQISVLGDWKELPGGDGQPTKSSFLRAAHAGACEIFTTVLGPDGDEFHQSHFHMDLGCHGRTCTFKLCQ